MVNRCYKVSLKDVEEVEAQPPFNRRFFKTLFKPDSDIKASVFVERFEPGAESFPHSHIPPQVEVFYGLMGTGICELVSDDRVEAVLRVNEVLDALAEQDPQAAALVKLRFFVGLTLGDAAAALDISRRTADRLWAYSKAWLHAELQAWL